MNRNQFYKKFEETPKEKRFVLIESAPTPTSLFVIFQQLTQVRAQLRFFEEREEALLTQAERAFDQIKQ
jgi:hypothetical protein